MGRAPNPSLREFHLTVARATVSAYRDAMGRGEPQEACFAAAKAACVAVGGDPGALGDAAMRMVTAASIEHGEWFYAPVRRRLEHEERHLRALGCWPPPLDRKKWPLIPPLP